MTHAPISSMMPISSASGMKTPGGTSPRSGCCQRTRASAPDERAVAKSNLRLVVDHELPAGGRAAEVPAEIEAVQTSAAEAALEEADRVADHLPWPDASPSRHGG